MSENRDWQYYQFDPLTGDFPIRYFRRWRGVTDRLDTETREGVSTGGDTITRYIANGEVGLDETTQGAIEAAVGFPLPERTDPITTTDPQEVDLFSQATHVIGSEPWFEALEDAEAIQ